MTTWFTSDNHFGHKNIRHFCPETRPAFDDVSEMDHMMIRMWQAQVQPEDIVWCLGDFSFHSAEKTWNILGQLPGYKHLVFGNHDKVLRKNPKLIDRHFVSAQEYKEISVDGIPVVLFHYPIWEWNRMHRGAYHLFGHVHGTTSVPGRAIDVGIDGPLSGGDMRLYSWEIVHHTLKGREIRPHNNRMAGSRDL